MRLGWKISSIFLLLCLWKSYSFSKVLLKCVLFWKGLPNLSVGKNYSFLYCVLTISWWWPNLYPDHSPLVSTCGCNKHLKFIMAKQQSPIPLNQIHCFPSQEKETAIHQKAWAKSSYLTSPPIPHLILQPALPSKEIWNLSTSHPILFIATMLVQATVCWPGLGTTYGWCMGGQIIG